RPVASCLGHGGRKETRGGPSVGWLARNRGVTTARRSEPKCVSGAIVDRIRIKTDLRMARRFHVAAPVAAPARLQGGRASQGPSLREEEGPGGRPRLPDEGEEAGEGPRGVPAGGRRRLASDLYHAPASEPHRPALRGQGHPRRLALDDA